ncbi:MAG: protein-L-isoaspartate(D-aspartate) O-methyltransferase [Caldilineaceae bacterium]|nr:protein-L-isoaspartate(D-aspartate) O-methyltransferase [Caldilineaceae bacterium]
MTLFLRPQRIDKDQVLAAMRRVQRHRFVPSDCVHLAYEDQPLPIGYGQTISQPTIVGIMTELLNLYPGDRVLEIGTGSGYQAAVLAELDIQVYSVEIVPELAVSAAKTLLTLGYTGVHVRHADGYLGWPEHAPYDAIIVTAAAPALPPPLVNQLRAGGRLVIPIGPPDGRQYLWLFKRSASGDIRSRRLGEVAFVPFTRAEE